MRVVYMDESGLSRREPFLVVSAVIIHGDNQLGALEDKLRAIISKYVPEKLQEGFVLHAADLFYGNKKNLPPEIHDEKIRLGMLERVLSIPKELGIEVCFSLVHKEKFLRFNSAAANKPAHELQVAMHATAMAQVTISVEKWMRKYADAEIAMLFAENNDEVRKAAKETQVRMKSKDGWSSFQLTNGHLFLPLVKIKDGINFVTKEESLALQLADSCAWVFRRHHAMNGNDAKTLEFASLLKGQIYSVSMLTTDSTKRLQVKPFKV